MEAKRVDRRPALVVALEVYVVLLALGNVLAALFGTEPPRILLIGFAGVALRLLPGHWAQCRSKA